MMNLDIFKMQLFPGFEEEYKKRHDALWPELQHLLKATGIHEYSAANGSWDSRAEL